MKLSLANPIPFKPTEPISVTSELTELRQLYGRMVTNSHSDSESVRQSILARMILLQSEITTKYFSTNSLTR